MKLQLALGLLAALAGPAVAAAVPASGNLPANTTAATLSNLTALGPEAELRVRAQRTYNGTSSFLTPPILVLCWNLHQTGLPLHVARQSLFLPFGHYRQTLHLQVDVKQETGLGLW